MKIIFFGLGSIGKRHAKIIKASYTHNLYAFRSGINDTHNELGIKELNSWEEVEKLKPDIAFITNPTSLHIETAIRGAQMGAKLFIEKPIGSSLENLDNLIKIVKEKKLVTYVAYNLRFHPVIKKIKKYLQKEKPLNVRVVCSSYLPSWRPGQNHLSSYSANSSLGGGVILDLSHELDYVYYLMGKISKIQGSFSKASDVTVDAEDNVDMIAFSENVAINIHLNFFSQHRQRYIQLDFKDLSVVGDLIDAKIKEYKKEKLAKSDQLSYEKGEEYKEQLKYFFENINNNQMMNNLLEASELFRKILKFKNG